MSDYQAYLNQSILELLVEDLLDTFIVSYLTALANASKLRMPAATDRIRDDVSLAFKFFSTLKPAKELEQYFEVVELVLALLEASKSLVFLSFWEFAKIHGPNVSFVEGLMKARDDLDRTAVSEVLESVKRKVKEEGLTDRKWSQFLSALSDLLFTTIHLLTLFVFFAPAPEPTIMKKIAIQGTFARLLRSAGS